MTAPGRALIPVLVVLLVLGACREAAEPFEPRDRMQGDFAPPSRLTFSPHDDRSPTWNATSDSIYYSGYSEDHAPDAPATVLAISLGGGLATPVLRNVQVSNHAPRWLIAPATAPDGGRMAITVMGVLRPRLPCDFPEVMLCPTDIDASSIRLESGVVYARAISAIRDLFEEPALAMTFGDHQLDTVRVGALPTYSTRFHPYQVAYIRGRDYPSRASWAPDSRRLVTSDGLRLLVWDTETGAVDTVTGTEDGTSPAWSPDGSRIAFTWTERTDSTTSTCALGFYVDGLDGPIPVPQCYEHRVEYVMNPPRIVLVNPDGSDRQVVAQGTDPTWGPDGALYFAADDGIGPLRRRDPVSGALTIVEGSDGAREPAVSPDGHWVAYSRGPRLSAPRDIHVLSLP